MATITYELDCSRASSPIGYEDICIVPPSSLDYWNMVTDSINQCAGILLKILVTQWKIQCLLKDSYMYLDMAMSILPISDALLIRLRLSLNHLTAAPVIATEPCNTTFQRR